MTLYSTDKLRLAKIQSPAQKVRNSAAVVMGFSDPAISAGFSGAVSLC